MKIVSNHSIDDVIRVYYRCVDYIRHSEDKENRLEAHDCYVTGEAILNCLFILNLMSEKHYEDLKKYNLNSYEQYVQRINAQDKTTEGEDS